MRSHMVHVAMPYHFSQVTVERITHFSRVTVKIFRSLIIRFFDSTLSYFYNHNHTQFFLLKYSNLVHYTLQDFSTGVKDEYSLKK